jgi:hypothetical protein
MSTHLLTRSSSVHRFWGTKQLTSSHLVLRPKPKNCCGDFETQIIKLLTLVLRPKPRNRHSGDKSLPPVLRLNQKNTCFSSPPCVRWGLHTASTNLLIVQPPSTRFVPDHSWYLAPSLLLLPRSSLLPAMSHSPPTHHKRSKHVSPHWITQYGLVQPKCTKFKFKLDQVNYSSHI